MKKELKMKLKNCLNRIKTFVLTLFITTSLHSCIEEFDFNIAPGEIKLVVEGLVTNEAGPYYVRLTNTCNNFYAFGTYPEIDSYKTDINNIPSRTEAKKMMFEPVKNAIVVISDNNGTKDTLVAPPDTIIEQHIWETTQGIIDTSNRTMTNRYQNAYGWYQTTKLKGEPGNTYYLTIMIEDKTFEAECYMPEVPQIDTVVLKYNEGMEGKSGFVEPYISFMDNLQQEDYYLTNIAGVGGVWHNVVFDDLLFDGYVNNYKLDDGIPIDWWTVSYPWIGDNLTIYLYSITKDAYLFYKAPENQFTNDGGSFSPSPASPQGNISNGALGFFRASAVSSVSMKNIGIDK